MLTNEQLQERAYLLYSRGRGAEQYLDLLGNRPSRRILVNSGSHLSTTPAQASGGAASSLSAVRE